MLTFLFFLFNLAKKIVNRKVFLYKLIVCNFRKGCPKSSLPYLTTESSNSDGNFSQAFPTWNWCELIFEQPHRTVFSLWKANMVHLNCCML